MAKKKPTHHGKPPQNQDHHTAMDEASEKFENLKSLNNMLVKEAIERRQLVDSLVRSKGSLESALTLSESENQALQAELTRLSDRMAQLDLEREVGFVFVAVQVSQQAEVVEREREGLRKEKAEIEKRLGSLEREMREVVREKNEIEKVRRDKESEIGVLREKFGGLLVEIENERDGSVRVSTERDVLRADLDVQIEEANGLRFKLIESEKIQKKIEEELEKLKIDYNGVVEEKEERERRIEAIMKDKDSIERSLGESNRVIEGLKRKIEEVVGEKQGMEEERNLEARKKNELEISVAALKEMVLNLQKEELRMRVIVVDLENRCYECREKEGEMEKEIDELMEEKDEMGRSFESLVEEKGLVKKKLDETSKELDEERRKMEEIVQKKIEIEEVKVKRESEIVEMQREVSELRDAVSALEALCRDQRKENGHLKSDVEQYRDAINQITVERNEARKGFDEEREKGMILRGKICAMEKNIEEIQKVVDELKAENRNVIGEKKEVESQCAELKKAIHSLEDSLSKARKEVDYMNDKVERSDASSELVLKMLRSTGAKVCVSKDEGDVEEIDWFFYEKKDGDSVKPYVEQLVAIENAFKKREIEVKDMKRELEFLQDSAAQAQKGKNFWTFVSSATTLVAAASVAYVARGR